ncbi:MAG: hypothetical protein WD751_10360 [Anaerolineales bacterium]
MLTLEILYALLQGLPAKYLDFLEPPWPPFAQRIENALAAGLSPMQALQDALDSMNDWAKGQLRKMLSQVHPVMALPGLTYRQKEALIALRACGVASLAGLGRYLMADRSNLHKRLAVLVRKGYALRFFRSGGVSYYAVPSRMDRPLKTSIHDLLTKLIEESAAAPQVDLPNLPQLPQSP